MMTTMRVVADICIVPLGVGTSLSPYIAECERVLLAAGLNPRLHAYGTNVEGEWDAVFIALKACHEAVHSMGAPRVTTSMRLGTRTDREESIASKVNSVVNLVGETVIEKG
jgi:uncharacterized protein (TIGR00106 family)